jgi:hypothetical protein
MKKEVSAEMAVTTPDWLARREGELRPSKDGHSCSVYFAGQLQYVLMPVPAKGKYSCRVAETINGKRLDGPGPYGSAEEAVRGGLEDLRKALGW